MNKQAKSDAVRGLWNHRWFYATAPVGVLGLACVLVVLFAIAYRIAYPLDLEWMEGSMLLHAQRIIDGKSLYSAPSVDHIPFAYPPLYVLLLAGLGRIFHLSATLGRAISVIALGGIALVFGLAVFGPLRPLRRRALVLAGASLTATGLGLFFADYLFTGAWLDIVRNDTLYLFFCLTGLLLLVEKGHTITGTVVAGLLLALAFWTKQTTVIFIVAAGLYQLFAAPRRLPWLVLSVAVFTLIPLAIGNAITDGRLWFTLRGIHANHAFHADRLWPVTPTRLFSRHLWLWLAALVAAGISLPGRLPGRRTLFWGLMAVASVLTASLGSATAWAHTNALLPASLFTALFAAVAVAEAAGGETPQESLWRRLTALLCVLPLGAHLLLHTPSRAHLRRVTPNARDYHDARHFLALLPTLPGPVLIPYHPWYAVLAGSPGHFHLHALNDITAAGLKTPEGLARGIRTGRWKTIIYDRHGQRFWRQMPGLTRHYRRVRDLGRRAPRTFSGNPCSPRYIWLYTK